MVVILSEAKGDKLVVILSEAQDLLLRPSRPTLPRPCVTRPLVRDEEALVVCIELRILRVERVSGGELACHRIRYAPRRSSQREHIVTSVASWIGSDHLLAEGAVTAPRRSSAL